MTKTPTPKLSVAFALAAELAKQLVVQNIKDLGEPWEHSFGKWHIAINGLDTQAQCSMGTTVPPFHMAVFYNGGWPVAILNPFNGSWVVAEHCSENDFILELEKLTGVSVAEVEKNLS